MTNPPDERGIASYLKRTITAGPVNRRLFPWFQGTVVEVFTSGFNMQVRVRRSGELVPDGGWYAVAVPNYRPRVGDIVDLLWRDEDTGYAVAPRTGAGATAPWSGWVHYSRYVVGTGGSVDTSSNPGGDVPLPTGYSHAKVLWSAIDTSTNTTATFGGLQLGIAGGAIDTGAHYNWTDFSNANGGATAGSGSTGAADWAAFVTTGGATGPGWMSHGEITMLDYANPTQNAKAFWETLQVNNSTIIRRSGAGYYFGPAGVVTLLHFFAGSGHLAAGTTFELLVAS